MESLTAANWAPWIVLEMAGIEDNVFDPFASLLSIRAPLWSSVGFNVLDSVVVCPNSGCFEAVLEPSDTTEGINVAILVPEPVNTVPDSIFTLLVS